jgi:hypothetical protein
MATLRNKPWYPSPEPAHTLDHLQDLARAANSVMDRADIATIHSFAYSLLKRAYWPDFSYPEIHCWSRRVYWRP